MEGPVAVQREITAAIDQAPFTRQHAAFVTVLLAALILDYAKPFSLSFIIPGMRAMWELSEVEGSYLAVAGLSGTVVGSIFWGFLADRIGRRTTLLWTIAIFSLTTICGLALQYWQSLLACFVMGFGVGGEIPIVFALAAEYLPIKARERTLLFLAIIGSTVGYMLAALIAWGASAVYPDDFAWRVIWLVQLIPAAVLLILIVRRRVLPESARYLLAKGRAGEARAAAESLIGPIDRVAVSREKAPDRSAPLSTARLYGRTAALSLFSFAWGLANFGFITWLPTLLRNLGYSGAVSSGYLALSALVAVPALLVTAHLLTRWSTRWTLSGYAVGGAAALLGLAGLVAAGSLTPLLLVAVSSLILFFITSIGGAFSLYAAEVFPTEIRARRSGIVAGLGKFGGVVGPYFGGVWLGAGGSMAGLQLPFAAALLAAAVVLALTGVETRGLSLEQVGARGEVRRG